MVAVGVGWAWSLGLGFGGGPGDSASIELFGVGAMAGTGKDDGEGGVFGGPGGLHLLDTTGADKSVWLLKVPPLVGHQWLKQQDGAPVLAKVTMSMDPLNPNSDSVEVRVGRNLAWFGSARLWGLEQWDSEGFWSNGLHGQ